MNKFVLTMVIMGIIGICSLIFSLTILIKKIGNKRLNRKKNLSAIFLLLCSLLWLVLAGMLYLDYENQLSIETKINAQLRNL